MAKVAALSLADRLAQSKGWSAQEKYPFPLKDNEGNVIEILYLKPVSRAKYKEITERMEDAGEDTSRLTVRMVVESCFLADGSKAFSPADIPKLLNEISSTQLNELEMAVLNAGRALDVKQEKKD